MIWAIILAAGESKRMGEAKLLLPLGRKSIIEQVLDAVVSSNVDGTLVVLGSEGEKIERKIRKYPVKITVNPHFEKGMLSSVQSGFEALPKNVKAALVVLGDQPRISKEVIDALLEAFKIHKKGIAIPVYKNIRGHPVLIDLKYQQEIQNLNPKIGLRELIYSHPEEILEVRVKASPATLRDIDDWNDYQRELKKKGRAPAKKRK